MVTLSSSPHVTVADPPLYQTTTRTRKSGRYSFPFRIRALLKVRASLSPFPVLLSTSLIMSFSLPGIPQNSTLGEDLAILVQVAQDLRSARVRTLI